MKLKCYCFSYLDSMYVKAVKKDQQIYLFDARTEMYMFALYFTLILKHF